MMNRRVPSFLVACLTALHGLPVLAALAAPPKAEDFAWVARLEIAPGTSLARIVLPADALTRLQSVDAADVRVFNGKGEPVGFAFTGLTAPKTEAAPQTTPEYKAIPLFSVAAGKSPGAGSMRVQVNESGKTNSVWVRLQTPSTANPAVASSVLPSVIFNSREASQSWRAIDVQATLPANSPVQLAADISTDLAQWTPVALRGRLYHFEGSDSPRNDRLTFDPPLVLDKHYLRLSWYGQAGVQVKSIAPVPAPQPGSVQPARAILPPARQVDKSALEWSLDFMTPISALVLVSSMPNTLLPVRILGRNDAKQSWRQLGQTLVYRLGADDTAPTNAPLNLAGASVRQLRVETSNGMALDAAGLQASAEFRPLQVLFMASGPGPFVLAAGRAQTPAAALNLSDLQAVVPANTEQLPMARIAQVTLSTPKKEAADTSWWGAITSSTNQRAWALWGILIAGVVLLGGVAWKLIGQLNTKAPT